MKKIPLKKNASKAYTLTEVLIVAGLFGIVFVAFGSFMIQSLKIFTWMTATNVAHQEARTGIQNMLKSIHQSPSPLLLVNVNGEDEPKEDTFWGVVYQRLIAGPLEVRANTLVGGDSTLTLVVGDSFVPQIGQQIIFPGSSFIYTITFVDEPEDGGLRDVSISPPLSGGDAMSIGSGYDGTDGGSGGSITMGVYLTQRSAFLIRESSEGTGDLEMRRYDTVLQWQGSDPPDGCLVNLGKAGTADDSYLFIPEEPGSTFNAIDDPDTFVVLSRGLRGMSVDGEQVAPFSVPTPENKALDRRSVAAVQLSLQDSAVSNLIEDEDAKFRLNATTIFLNSTIPQQYLLTLRY